jgi:hypothetical protein
MFKRMNVTKQNRKWLHLGFALEFIIVGTLLASPSKATSYEESVNQRAYTKERNLSTPGCYKIPTRPLKSISTPYKYVQPLDIKSRAS